MNSPAQRSTAPDPADAESHIRLKEAARDAQYRVLVGEANRAYRAGLDNAAARQTVDWPALVRERKLRNWARTAVVISLLAVLAALTWSLQQSKNETPRQFGAKTPAKISG